MPTYEFKCKDCKVTWEDMQSISLDKHESPCPKCGKICPCGIGGGSGFLFVDRHWNPIAGFPSNDMKKDREVQETEKMLDATMPKVPQKMVDASHKRIKNINKAKLFMILK